MAFRFVELEKSPDGSPLLVNPHRVQLLTPHGEHGTVITFANGDSEIVSETPRAVAELLENATHDDRER